MMRRLRRPARKPCWPDNGLVRLLFSSPLPCQRRREFFMNKRPNDR
jgi:hypothetical protein